MTKDKLISYALAKAKERQPDISKIDVMVVYDAIMDGIKQALLQDDDIMLQEIGKLKVSERAARKGRNPQTGESIDIPASKALKVTTAKNMREALNPKPVEEVKPVEKKSSKSRKPNSKSKRVKEARV